MNNCLVLGLGLVLISCSPLLANGRKLGEHNLLNEICHTLTDKECMNYGNADPNILNAKSYYELAEVALKVGSKKAIEGEKFLEGLAKVEKNPAIEKCVNYYKDYVVGSFEGVWRSVLLKQKTASYDALIVVDQIGYCKTTLENANINNPTITALNSHISWYLLIAESAICNLDLPN